MKPGEVKTRPMTGSLHEADWADIDYGVKVAQHATKRLKDGGVRIEIPTPARWWEYGSVIQLVKDWKDTRPTWQGMDVLDVGSGWGAVGPALCLEYDDVRVTEYEPDQMYWADRESCNRVLAAWSRPQISYAHYDIMHMPVQQFDLVSCVSVMEHIPPAMEQQCWVELVKRIRPGGVLFVDVDCVPDPTKQYVCDEMRAHNFTIREMMDRVIGLESLDMVPLFGEPDWNYNGNAVHDSFTFFRVTMVKKI